MQDSFSIRPIAAEDNPTMARIIRSVLGEFGANRRGFAAADPETDRMFETYQGPGARYFVVTQGEEVLGGGGVGPLKGADKGVCELQKMYFLPALRGHGQGRAMLTQCLETARELGYQTMYLETLAGMHKARSLYEKAGFVELDKPWGSTGHSGCDRWMVRTL